MKSRILVLMVFMVAMFSFAACGKFDSNVPCDWCGDTPTKTYVAKNPSVAGEEYHICKKDTETCMNCGNNKATKHYESLLGFPMSTCDDCYNYILGR